MLVKESGLRCWRISTKNIVFPIKKLEKLFLLHTIFCCMTKNYVTTKFGKTQKKKLVNFIL